MGLFLAVEVATDLDVETMVSDLKQSLSEITANNIFGAAVVAAISLVVVKLLLALLDRALRRSKMDDALKKLLHSLIKAGLLFVALIVILGRLGIEVTSLVAVLSVVGLAFSLALQNFLSNVAGGMQILASHPFKPGDYVEAGGCSGTVTDIGMFYTKLVTFDNKLIQLPNSTIVSANIINYSAQPTRRVDLKVSASYNTPTDRVIDTLKQMAADHPLVLDDPEPVAHVDEYGESAIRYVVRAWTATDDYWTVYNDMMDGFKLAFDWAGVKMSYPHVNVHMTAPKK